MDPMTKVSVRDFAIFQPKLLIDGLKDGAVFTMSFVAFGVDLLLRRHGRRRCFYKMMRVSEKFDLWLNLHGATEGAESDADGLFGRSEAGTTQCWVRSSRSFEGAMNRLPGQVRRLRGPKVDRHRSV